MQRDGNPKKEPKRNAKQHQKEIYIWSWHRAPKTLGIFCEPLQQINWTQGGGFGNLWFVAIWLEAQVTIWSGGQSCRTEPLTCEIWCYLKGDSAIIEFR